MSDLEEFRKQKKGQVTPKALTQHLLENISDVETIVYVIRKKDGIIHGGWSEVKTAEAIGLYELGKTFVIQDMEENE